MNFWSGWDASLDSREHVADDVHRRGHLGVDVSIEGQQQRGVVRHNVGVVDCAPVQRVTSFVEGCGRLRRLGESLLALLPSFLVAESSLAFAVFVCHELVDNTV